MCYELLRSSKVARHRLPYVHKITNRVGFITLYLLNQPIICLVILIIFIWYPIKKGRLSYNAVLDAGHFHIVVLGERYNLYEHFLDHAQRIFLLLYSYVRFYPMFLIFPSKYVLTEFYCIFHLRKI